MTYELINGMHIFRCINNTWSVESRTKSAAYTAALKLIKDEMVT